MTQLSTDSLVYTQIISKVQKFLIDYTQNKNNSPENFDKEYKKLLDEIQKSVGRPMTNLNFFEKGEIPSSEKFNTFSSSISNDVNILVNQLDALVANYINSFNIISSEIESEKNFIKRIRSKIATLELYSNSSVNNVTYFGDTFNNMDFIETKAIRSGYSPDVTDGFASLSRKRINKIPLNIGLVNQNYNNQQNKTISYVDISNGTNGNVHLYHQDAQNNNPFMYERDSALLRTNELAMLDESPATYFEYEAITVANTQNKPEYEFQYSLGTGASNVNYMNWSNFDNNNPLKMTVELTTRAKNGENINYISIIPFFGYDNIDKIKNIKISSIKLFNESTNSIFNVVSESNPAYIGADIYAPTLSLKQNYHYNKGVFRFEKVKANKIYITFEQSQFNDVSIKHAYWKPYESQSLASTPGNSASWRGQERFVASAIVQDSQNYRVEDVSWDKNRVIPSVSNPTEKKSSSNQIVPIRVKYWQQSQKNFNRVKLISTNSGATPSQASYYLSSNKMSSQSIKVRTFSTLPSDAIKFDNYAGSVETLIRTIGQENDYLYIVGNSSTDINQYIVDNKKQLASISASGNLATFITSQPHGLVAGDKVYIEASIDPELSSIMNRGEYTVASIVSPTSFSVSTSSSATPPIVSKALTVAYFVKCGVNVILENLSREEFQDLNDIQKNTDLFLRRNFEFIPAKRAAIGIRDIFVGIESYNDAAEIVSKPFEIYGNLELLSLQVEDYEPVEKNSNGEIIARSQINYYVSVDGGSKWIEISPIERSFSGKPEILAFNQNLGTSEMLPQIAYFNSPEIPQQIKTVQLKIVIKKDRNLNATPIVYSYKIGAKVS